MGITGLIPFLESATRKITVRDLRGSTVGIDTYCWLHKGAISCAEKLIRGDETDLHIKYCLKYVNLLLSHNIKPVLVFDGRHLPAKALTEKRRNSSRKEAKEKAKELLREGNVNEARTYINRAVNITHAMAHQLIVECRKRNVDCIVAPYEADGQLAYLSRSKLIDYVITEDSDLTLFGCPKVIFKFDLAGQGLLFEAEHLHKAMGCKEDRYKYADLFLKFQLMCILSGCDYLDSLKGVGLVKACKFVLMTEETDLKRCLSKLPQYLNLKGITVDDEYKDGFLRSLNTFRHMIVYDPSKRRQCHLTEPEEADLPFCDNAGEKLDEETAFQLAIGNTNPFTLKQLDSWDPSELNTEKYPSIWGEQGKGGTAAKTTTSNVIKTVHKKPFSTPTKRKIPPPEHSDDDQDAKNTSFDIMQMYLGQEKTKPPMETPVANTPPEPKKFRLSLTGAERETKNPFLKRKDSETKEESEVDAKQHVSLLQQANSIKTEKSNSKFQRTTIEDRKVNIVSRFFSPVAVAADKDELKTNEKQELKAPEADNETKLEKVRNGNENETLLDKEVEQEEGSDKVRKDGDNNPGQENKRGVRSLEAIEKEGEEVDSERDSEGFDHSALEFVQAEYSDGDGEPIDSQMQRDNENSPVPWTSSQSDKENDKAKINQDEDSAIVIIEDDDTPQKIPLVRKWVKSPKKKAAGAAKANKSNKTAKRQVTLTSFFHKK